MNDHENHVAISRERNSSPLSDRFGVSWGEELVDELLKKQKGFKYYTSFYLHGTQYRQDDTVYLHSDDGPPYIGRIGKLYESIKNKKKQMVVRWFCRPSELPAGLPDVDYNENCKDIFMMWGNGAKNVNNPACTIKHCSVVCTGGKQDWNTNFPTLEEIAAADHVFDRVYDLRTRMLRTLECIVKHYGERYVTGMALPRSTKGASTSGKRFVAGRNQLNCRPPHANLLTSDRPLRLDCTLSELTSFPAVVSSPNSPPIPLVPAEGQKESSVRKSLPSAVKAASHKCEVARSALQKFAEAKMIRKGAAQQGSKSALQKFAEAKMIRKGAAQQGSKRALVDSVGNAVSSYSQKRPRIDSSYASLHQQAQEKLGGRNLPSPRVGEGRSKSPLPSPRMGEGRKKSPLPSPRVGEGRRKSPLPSPRVAERRMKSPLPSPRVGDVRKKSPHKLTTAEASSLRQAPFLAGSRIPSPPLGRKKSLKEQKTAAVTMPQEAQLTSLRVQEGRKKSPNDPTTADPLWSPQDHERFAGGSRIPSPGASEGIERSSNHLTNGDALRPQQALERLSSGKLPSPGAVEWRKKSLNDLTNGDALRPQQALERLSSGKLSSSGAGEGRKTSSNDLADDYASRPQHALERFSSVKLPSSGAGEGRKRSSNDLTNADSLLSQQVRERLAGGKHSSLGAGEGTQMYSNDHTAAEPQGAAVLNRERQKGMSELSNKQSSLEAKKRHLSELRGELKKHRLSAPSHTVDGALKVEIIKVRDNVSASVASDPKIGELRSPRVIQRSLTENGPGRQQALGGEAHLSPTSQKQDGRVPSTLSDEILNQVKASRKSGAMDVDKKDMRLLPPEVAYKRSTLLDEKCRSYPMSEERHCVRNQSNKEANDDNIAAPSRTHTVDPKDAVQLVNSHGHEKVGKYLSPVQQNGANAKSVKLDQDKRPFNERSADALGRRDVYNKQEDAERNSEMLQTMFRNAPSSNHGKLLSDEAVPPIFKENRFVPVGNQNVKIGESQAKASSARDSFASSKRTGASLEDSRHGEMGPLPKAPKKSPSTSTARPVLPLGPLLAGLEASTRKNMVMMKSILQRTKNKSQQSGEGLKAQMNGLLAKSDPKMSSKNLSDDMRSGEERRPPQGLVKRFAQTLARKPGSIAKMGGRPPALRTILAPSAELQGEKIEPKKKIFKIPWEESLRIALEQRKALLLENLDPWFSSSEVENMLEDLLKIGCDVRMLPPKSFACYTSGQALVLFRTQNSAEEALRKLTENWLIWSKDEMPVLASMADTETAVGGRIHGFYTAEMLGSRGALGTGEGQKSAVATSHCSQPNTVEYEMGIKWRLLQDRHEEAWSIATKVEQNKVLQVEQNKVLQVEQNKADHEGHQSEQKI